MTIIECESQSDVPFSDHVTYVIDKDMTVEAALARFEARFGVKPEVGYRWREYMYINKPDGK